MGITPDHKAVDIETYLREKTVLVNACIDQYFKGTDPDVPPVLMEAMRYSLLAGGKRIRPVLCIASYEACGGRGDDILLSASALEVIHTYSLIHDDLPAMDNDDLRRGRPTNHKVYGEAVAILAGDGLLSEAFLMMMDNAGVIPQAYVFEALRELARASGPAGMVGGQVVDILSEDKAPDPKTLEYIHAHKTGALLRSSVRIGGILAGAKPEMMDALRVYGDSIGLAFQIVDDILDIKGDESVLGKPVGSDLKKHKMTYPALYGIEASMSMAEELISRATNALAAMRPSSKNTAPLEGIAQYILRRTH